MIKNIKMSWTAGALVALPVCLGPISLIADQTFIRDSPPSMVTNIAEGFEVGEGDAAIKEFMHSNNHLLNAGIGSKYSCHYCV